MIFLEDAYLSAMIQRIVLYIYILLRIYLSMNVDIDKGKVTKVNILRVIVTKDTPYINKQSTKDHYIVHTAELHFRSFKCP